MELKPNIDDFTGGWANREGENIPLRLPGGIPPESDPVIYPADNGAPEMLVARYYFWDTATAKHRRAPNYVEAHVRELNALDLVITKPSSDRIGVLISSRSPGLLRKRDGALRTLEKVLKLDDPDSKLEFSESHLKLKNEEIFLWLAVSLRDQAKISPTIELGGIDALTSHGQGSRSTDLKSGVDFDRSAFLTAIADGEIFGPVDINFAHHTGGVSDSYAMRLFVDGGFEIRKKYLHLKDQLDRPQLMFEATILLAFSIIPDINQLFIQREKAWEAQRNIEIKDAMKMLEERYKVLRQRLES